MCKTSTAKKKMLQMLDNTRSAQNDGNDTENVKNKRAKVVGRRVYLRAFLSGSVGRISVWTFLTMIVFF